MNIKYYKSLCNFCDKILLSKASTLFTHSISALHVLKEHPVILSIYFKTKNRHDNFKNSTFKKIYSYFLNFIFERKNFILSHYQKKGADVLILSNLINYNHASMVKDFYFGDIEKNLNKEKIKTFTVLRNFTSENSLNINKILKKNKILLFKRTSYFKELYIIYKIILEYFLLKKNSQNLIINNLKINFLSIFSLRSMVSNLRLYYQIKDLIKIIKPKILIIPFEGHSWERLIIKMVKDVDIDTKIAAYQFTVTTKYQHSLFRPLKKDYNPDIIFTSGIETKKLFQKKYNCPIKILGSNKYKKISKIKKNQNSNFLVIPEAFYSETYNLLNYTIDTAKILPDYKFIFRCHPMMKTEEFKNNINQQNNIIFSNNHIDDDISSCKYVLFRGSAAVFEAVNRGLLPIYLDINNEPNINPFKDFFLKNYNVVKDKDIYKILDHYKINQLNKKVVKYSNNYFTKFNTSIIKSLL